MKNIIIDIPVLYMIASRQLISRYFFERDTIRITGNHLIDSDGVNVTMKTHLF